MRQRKGFTLVELSIVLVIIGLLIGGILAAQSMISTAKINAQVRQIGQFDSMVLNFKDSYRYLPGDAPTFGGDGDGVIELTATSGYDNDIESFAGEIGNFWHDLDSTQFPGIAPFVQPGAKPNSSGSSKNVPASKLGSEGSFFIASALGITALTADTANPRNFYAILHRSQAQALSTWGWYSFSPTTSVNSAVKPVDLLALDQKIDDGLANSGNVLSGAIGTNISVGGIIANPLASCSSGSTYVVANTGYECTPLIRIGGSVGVPQ